MSKFAETLNDLLKENGLSILEFSKKINISSDTLYDLKKFNPTIQNALKIVDYFSSSLDYFERKSDVFEYSFNKNYKINFYDNFAKKLKKLNKNFVDFKNDCGISYSSVKRWKKGMLPTYSNLLMVAKYLNCSIDELLGRY